MVQSSWIMFLNAIPVVEEGNFLNSASPGAVRSVSWMMGVLDVEGSFFPQWVKASKKVAATV